MLLILSCAAPVYGTATNKTPHYAIASQLATRSLLTDISHANGRMVAVGERGHIIVSEDNGTTWRQAKVPTQVLLTGVFMLDNMQGWSVGHDATILATSDGGYNWQQQYSAPEKEQPLLDIWFRDADNGIAIGAYGLYMTTSDGGQSWHEKPIGEDDFHLNSLHVAGNGDLYIAGEAGALYFSDNNGADWKKIPTPYNGSFFNVLSLNDGSLLLFGLRGKMFHSPNHGKSWMRVNTKTDASLFQGIQLPNETIIIVGLDGVVLVGNGNGENFLLHKRSGGKGILAVARSGNGDLVLAGESGISRITSVESLR